MKLRVRIKSNGKYYACQDDEIIEVNGKTDEGVYDLDDDNDFCLANNVLMYFVDQYQDVVVTPVKSTEVDGQKVFCIKRTTVQDGNTIIEYFEYPCLEKAREITDKEYYELLCSEKHALPGMFEEFSLISLPTGSIKWEVCEKIDSDIKQRKTMSLTYPYSIEIWDKETATNTLRYMCRDCPNLTTCSGTMAFKCGEIKKKIIEIFGAEE